MVEKRILVVDDDASIIELLRDLLVSHGYAVECADCATTALDLVREHIFDAALLDFDLPDMSGVMLHRSIRQMDEELAANTLFVSGQAQSDDNLGYYSTFGVGFLSKPFSIEEVVDALEALWNADEPVGS